MAEELDNVGFETRLERVQEALRMENQAWRDVAGANNTKPPAEFLGPLSKDLLIDPVKAIDGIVYERSCIKLYLRFHDTMPNKPSMPASDELESDSELRQRIIEWRHNQVLAHWVDNPPK
ncbi:uncharacterized protein AMSG_07695 [Thecamonas trahens ATCC 50062]|uniref:U-box domain-containing protein n=1 Tax=Thecamonas trahens ATCC 50062 TaxID=461836 RepID=A0A0L0DGP1_THETB|nr:hypothetical protein AMSG_07695 [Thecamonas trahens ATCC 50062]KNC51497.1 hypothetical protein AMSG_07695 [Thecamonas trahens ATCC 50062]|eukprot:XP_013756155.1 hypothetical protein AMSG_07695 [Thecamonas trahens ATCC 50062]